MSVELTKEADALIVSLYKKYKEDRKSGITKDQAKFFGNSDEIHDLVSPKWPLEDTVDACLELCKSGILDCSCADDAVASAHLSNQGIIYMENRFKDGLKEVTDYLVKIRSIFLP